MQKNKKLLIFLMVVSILTVTVSETCRAETSAPAAPSFLRIGLDQQSDPGRVSAVLEIFFLLTVLSLAPAILIMLTSFTRIVIVLSVLRQAIGTQQMPPNQIIIGLALFLTLFIMTPVWEKANQEALQPYLAGDMGHVEALETASKPLRKFMTRHIREKDLALLIDIAQIDRPANMDEVPMTVVIPSFIIGELKTAFQIGFLLYIPFLIVDMVVASVLLSMGMMMLPPVMISLPFKLMLFVLADGWHLIVGSLVKGFM